MSDGLLIVSAFWIWWFADALRWRREPVVQATRGRFSFRGVARTRWRLRALMPWSWSVEVREPEFTLSPEGISNRVVGVWHRPAPGPETERYFTWEEVRTIADKGSMIWVNEQPFCRRSPGFGGEQLAREVEAFRKLSPRDREARAGRLTASLFETAAAGRALRRFEARTRLVAWAATLSAALWSGSTVLFGARLGLWPDPLPAGVPAARALTMTVAASAAAHLATLVFTWLAHRRLAPTAASQRRALLFNVALVPAQALRLRTHLAQLLPLTPLHSLAWVRLFASRPAFLTAAQDTVRDLQYPCGGPLDPALRWATQHQGRLLTAWLQRENLSPTLFLATPEPQSQRSCLYCPRCHSQFEDAHAHCPHGIPLKPLR